MGLDDVEVIMDLEERFHVSLDTDNDFDGTVGWFVREISNKFTFEYFNTTLQKIESYKFRDEMSISRSDYNEFAGFMGWSKDVGLFSRRNPGTKSRILYQFKGEINKNDFGVNVRAEVMRIIAERLNYKGTVRENDNIYKDLGAG